MSKAHRHFQYAETETVRGCWHQASVSARFDGGSSNYRYQWRTMRENIASSDLSSGTSPTHEAPNRGTF
jgi:hypothetical protein